MQTTPERVMQTGEHILSYAAAELPTADDVFQILVLRVIYGIFAFGCVISAGVILMAIERPTSKIWPVSALLLLLGIPLGLNALWLGRRFWLVSLVIACLMLIGFPIWTILGGCTIAVLLRPRVRNAYAAAR